MPTSNNTSCEGKSDTLGRSGAQIGLEVTLAVLMCFVSIVGNIVVLWIILTNKNLRNVTNLFIQNLAVIDVCLAAIGMPLWAFALYNGEWVLSQIVCDLSAYTFFVLSNAALYTLLMIAVNRYIRVVKCEHYSKIFGNNRFLFAMVASTWIVSLITCSTPFYGWGAFHYYPFASLCTFQWSRSHIPFFAFMAVLQPSPYVIVFCYFKIYARVRRNRIQVCTRKNRAACQSAHDAENKTMYVAFAIICVFVVSWLPAGTQAVLTIVGVESPRWSAALASYMVFMSTCLHPVIYGLLNPSFKQAFKAKFKRQTQHDVGMPTATPKSS